MLLIKLSCSRNRRVRVTWRVIVGVLSEKVLPHRRIFSEADKPLEIGHAKNDGLQNIICLTQI